MSGDTAFDKEAFETEFCEQFDRQRDFFRSGATHSYEFRRQSLLDLRAAIQAAEASILDALKSDLGKPAVEGFSSEVGFLYAEISFALKYLKKWMRPKNVSGPMLLFPAKSQIVNSPKGVCLIIGPWNYPLQLQLAPLIGALAAGNTAFLKPSEFAPQTAEVVHELVASSFRPEQVTVLQGIGSEVIPPMVESRRFDHLFFTGSTKTGKLIYEMAARQLTPVTLELGGKSPAIVDESANLKIAAKRITWGKFFNAGQTCVAPDYLLVQENARDEMLEHIEKYLTQFYGSDVSESDSYARIIHHRHWDRLDSQLKEAQVLIGGQRDRQTLFFAPTVVEVSDDSHSLIQEEIFGPILPVVTFSDPGEIATRLADSPAPLAFYVFTADRDLENKLIHECQFGGGCVNDVVAHLANPKLPFGGVGASGIGKYHGKSSFDEFSNQKGILRQSRWFDLPFRYPPYKDSSLGMLRKLLK